MTERIKMKNKTSQIAMRADDTLLAMIDTLRLAQGYRTRSAVIEQAIRELYNGTFPAYKSGRPNLVVPVTSAHTIHGQVVTSRAMEKQVLKAEEAKRLREYGTYICTNFYVKGTPDSATSADPASAKCEYKIVKGMRMKDAFEGVRFGNLPMGTGEWDEDIVLRRFVLQQTFPDFRFDELDAKKASANFTKQLDLLLTGFEKGELDKSVFPDKLLQALAQESRDRGVPDTLTDRLVD
jgi:hypothetical protein